MSKIVPFPVNLHELTAFFPALTDGIEVSVRLEGKRSPSFVLYVTAPHWRVSVDTRDARVREEDPIALSDACVAFRCVASLASEYAEGRKGGV